MCQRDLNASEKLQSSTNCLKLPQYCFKLPEVSKTTRKCFKLYMNYFKLSDSSRTI